MDVQAGGSIVLRHVMYKNSIQLTSFSLMTSIMGTPRMEKSGRPGDACQEALDKDQEWCMHLAEENCGGIRLCEEVGHKPHMHTKFIIWSCLCGRAMLVNWILHRSRILWCGVLFSYFNLHEY